MARWDFLGGSRRWRGALLTAAALTLLGILFSLARRPTAIHADYPPALFEVTRLPAPLPAPDLQLEILGGKPFLLSDAKGKVLMVHFWATWCPPCLEEIPSLLAFSDQLQRLYPGRFQLVMVSVDEGWAPVQNYFGRLSPAGIVLGLDRARRTTRAYYCIARGGCPTSYLFPESYVVDKRGQLVAYLAGSCDWSHPEVSRFFQRFLDG